MSRFTVILPEGTVILKNEETGQILRLSAESGPLVLGEIFPAALHHFHIRLVCGVHLSLIHI